jgi:hypothetical protein
MYDQTDFPAEQLQQRRQRVMDDIGTEAIRTVKFSPDRRSAKVRIVDFGKGTKWVDRVYYIQFRDSGRLFGDAPTWDKLEAYFTLRAIP